LFVCFTVNGADKI